MNDTDDNHPNGEAHEVREALIRVAQRAHRIEIVLIAAAAATSLILTVAVIIGMIKLQDYAEINRDLNQQNTRLLQTQKESSDFGLKAVQCILDQFALHRITNQTVHDHIAHALRTESTPISPLPPVPNEAEVAKACEPFYHK
jgi:cell division protein FtsL